MAEQQYHFRLFVAGQGERSRKAVRLAYELCQGRLPAGSCRLDVVDVLEDPNLAEVDRILATPTLMRLAPLPLRRVVGDLSSPDRVLWLLDVLQAPSRPM